MGTEIQSMHFGASKKQLSLHTGIQYIGENQKHETFCTVSENLHHGPAAIWAHLQPVLKGIKKKTPSINSIELFSDGPTTQYREKGNFYLASVEPQQLGFEMITWNFFEAGHGKGVPDAVGGTLKRNADRVVKYGKDVTSGQHCVHHMKNSETVCRLIDDEEILKKQRVMAKLQLKPVAGTMKLHQVVIGNNNEIIYRDISCTCKEQTECDGHMFKRARLVENATIQKTNERKAKIERTEPVRPKYEEKKEQHSTCIGSQVKNLRSPAEMSDYFPNIISQLKTCKSFKQLKHKCQQIYPELTNFEKRPESINIMDAGLEVDADAMDVYPNDVPDPRALFPCKVDADGNCLPSCGSVYAYGTGIKAAEMRVRILIELVLYDGV